MYHAGNHGFFKLVAISVPDMFTIWILLDTVGYLFNFLFFFRSLSLHETSSLIRLFKHILIIFSICFLSFILQISLMISVYLKNIYLYIN